MADPSRAGGIMVIASFSGGGSRAAALAHSALVELDQHPFAWNGRQTTLAQEIDMVAGVSGGSVAATHIAVHGVAGHLHRFPADFLDTDFQGRLIGASLRPANLYRMSSPWQGRGHLLAQSLDDQLFNGMTFGDLAKVAGRPYLIVGATDLANGSEFDFASDQLGLLCTSIDAVPLSFAVAASSSVPLVFSPMTLQNHADTCEASPGVRHAGQRPSDASARARLVQSESDSLARPDRRYLHLVDGAISDNLGLRRIADYVVQVGGIRAVLAILNDGKSGPDTIPRRIVFLSVNSETGAPSSLESSPRVPGTLDVLGALVNGNLGRTSRETTLVFKDAIDQWREELQQDGADVDIFSIEVNLGDLRDANLRESVLAIPTAFRISTDDRELLRLAAQAGLAESDEFRRFRESVTTER
jgi:NTE family protein